MSAISIMTLRVPPELHDQIKARAREKNISMNEWAVRALTYQYERSKQGSGTKVVTEVTL